MLYQGRTNINIYVIRKNKYQYALPLWKKILNNIQKKNKISQDVLTFMYVFLPNPNTQKIIKLNTSVMNHAYIKIFSKSHLKQNV